MTVEVLDSVEALRGLAPEWDALWRRAGRSAFQSPRWLLPWWQAFGNAAPRVAVLRTGGELRGVLPAYVLAEGEAKLLPIGAGTTDYLDVLGEGAMPMLQALLDRATLDGVVCCDLMEVPPGSALRGAAVPDWQGVWAEADACPVLRLGDEPAGIRRKLRMNRNRAERAGGWEVEAAGVEGLEALMALHQRRWAAEGEPGVLADPAILAFHRMAAPGLLEGGLLRLNVLRLAGQVVAAVYALLAPGRIEFYLSGYDTAHSFVSPGTLLLGAMLDQAAAEGRTEAHFLRGQESYKYAWGATDRRNARCRLTWAVSETRQSIAQSTRICD